MQRSERRGDLVSVSPNLQPGVETRGRSQVKQRLGGVGTDRVGKVTKEGLRSCKDEEMGHN